MEPPVIKTKEVKNTWIRAIQCTASKSGATLPTAETTTVGCKIIIKSKIIALSLFASFTRFSPCIFPNITKISYKCDYHSANNASRWINLKISFVLLANRAANLMRTRIGLLAQPNSMRSITDATQREQRHGLAWNWCVNRNGGSDNRRTAFGTAFIFWN